MQQIFTEGIPSAGHLAVDPRYILGTKTAWVPSQKISILEGQTTKNHVNRSTIDNKIIDKYLKFFFKKDKD